MTDSMVRSMKTAPLTTEKDRQRARALIEEVEKAVRESRARGVLECQTWATVAKRVTSQ
jgi:Asp/Glu/hydantoin racemase